MICRSLIILLFVCNNCFSLDNKTCDKKRVFSQEISQMRGFLSGDMNSISAVTFEDVYLPIPNRFVSRSNYGLKSFSSVAHPINVEYFGCVSGKVPRGLIEFGGIENCEACKKNKNYSIEVIARSKNYTFIKVRLLEFDVEIRVIFSKFNYVQVNDENVAISELWWKLLIERHKNSSLGRSG